MHCGTRTIRSSVKHLLRTVTEQYAEGKALANRAAESLNQTVFRQLGLRPLLRKDEHGEVLKIDLDGKETRALITDMCKLSTPGGRSELLEAVRAARTELGLSMAGMDGWTACLMHWGTAMRAGYVLRATDADRLAFRSHARWYVLKKALLVEKLVWYDWQLWSVFSDMFERFGSLRLICQEGMEGQQAINNDLARRSNHGANAGRIPERVKDLGAQRSIACHSTA